MSGPVATQPMVTVVPRTLLRVGFGLVWLVDASLKWMPGFRESYMDGVMQLGEGQPGWVEPWFRFWSAVQHPRISGFEYLVAIVETLIALAVIFGIARKTTYAAGALFSLMIWAVAEGFGGPYEAGASDIGSAVIYALVFVALLLLSYYGGPAPIALDRVLARRIPWWHHVAEFAGPTR